MIIHAYCYDNNIRCDAVIMLHAISDLNKDEGGHPAAHKDSIILSAVTT